MVVSFRG
jgi:hypothetical protein